MKLNRKNPVILIIVLLLLIVIPLTVWLALNPQILRRSAAEDEVTVNLVPVSTEAGLADTFSLDVYLNAGTLKVSGATIVLEPTNPGVFTIQNISFEADEQESAGKPFTHKIYNAQSDPYSFTVLAKRPDAQLPTGSFKIATITLQSSGPGTGTIGINTTLSEIVGVKEASDITNFAVAGTTATITSVGELCRLDICTANDAIDLVEQPRDDRKFNILVSWEDPAGSPASTPLFYKVYRGIGQVVANPHPDGSLVTTTLENSVVDTNVNAGFDGEQTIYYDIDTYMVCPDGSTTPTPTAVGAPASPSPTQEILMSVTPTP